MIIHLQITHINGAFRDPSWKNLLRITNKTLLSIKLNTLFLYNVIQIHHSWLRIDDLGAIVLN